MTAARAAAASETAEAAAPVNNVEPVASANDESEAEATEPTGAVEYEPEMGAGENVTPASDAEGDDTGTAT